jgi:hypothetical protein
VEAYEHAQLTFHRSLARSRPVGMCGSASFRVPDIPWLAAAHGSDGEAVASAPGDGDSLACAPGYEDSVASAPGYEDWYLVEDFTALGVLNEAAVGHGHRSPHDEAARRYGGGAGGLYTLVEGERVELLSAPRIAVWVKRPIGSDRRPLCDLLGDGMDPGHASLWRRQLVLGPAPEFCLLAGEVPAGVAPARLPDGWSATTIEREVLWSG